MSGNSDTSTSSTDRNTKKNERNAGRSTENKLTRQLSKQSIVLPSTLSRILQQPKGNSQNNTHSQCISFSKSPIKSLQIKIWFCTLSPKVRRTRDPYKNQTECPIDCDHKKYSSIPLDKSWVVPYYLNHQISIGHKEFEILYSYTLTYPSHYSKISISSTSKKLTE